MKSLTLVQFFIYLFSYRLQYATYREGLVAQPIILPYIGNCSQNEAVHRKKPGASQRKSLVWDLPVLAPQVAEGLVSTLSRKMMSLVEL